MVNDVEKIKLDARIVKTLDLLNVISFNTLDGWNIIMNEIT